MATATKAVPTKRNDATTKIDAKVLADAKVAASFRGLTVAEYISGIVRVAADRDIEQSIGERARAKAQANR